MTGTPGAGDKDRALYKRLVLSIADLEEAGSFVHRLLGRGASADAPPLDGTARKALQIALIVSYSRPFSTNRKTRDVQPTLPAAFLDQLTERQRTLHHRLKTLRDQEFAHTDPMPADVTVRVAARPDGTPHASVLRAGSSTRAQIQDDELQQIEDLIDSLLQRCLAEQQLIRGTFSPGEKF